MCCAATMLPVEISDDIINHLYNHSCTLLACSLTCRAWRARSQLHLFLLVTLDDEQRITQLVYALTSAPHLSCHIRHVVLPITLAHCEPFLVLCPLPNVESLTVNRLRGSRNIFTPRQLTTGATVLSRAFPFVRSLALQNLALGFYTYIQILLNRLPLLIDVRLTSIFIVSSEDISAEHIVDTTAPSLERLSLDVCTGPWAYRLWLTSKAWPWVQNLRWLELRDRGSDSDARLSPALGMLAGRLSGTLEQLHITTPRIEVLEGIVGEYCKNRHAHTALRKLTLCAIGSTRGPRRVVELFRLVRDLDLDPNAHIEIRLGDDVPRGAEWDAVIVELSRSAFFWNCSLGFFVEKMNAQKMDCVRGADALAPFGINIVPFRRKMT